MSSDLISYFNLDTNKTFLLTNRDISGPSFAIDSLLHFYAKSNKHILFISIGECWIHFNTIAAKCGVNLKILKEQNLLDIIHVLNNESFVWEQFVDLVNSKISNLTEGSLVLIDDISALYILNTNFASIYKFIHNICVDCSCKNITLGVGSHFPEEDQDEELHKFITSLVYQFDVMCLIDKIRTGFSTQVSGTVKIINSNLKQSQSYENQIFYKLNDRNVKLSSGSRF